MNRLFCWLPSLALSVGAGLPALAVAQSAAPPSVLPSLGEAGLMSLAAERDLGDLIAKALYRDPSAVDDYLLSEYLDLIWQPLLHAAKARGDISSELEARMAWQVVQIRDPSVNAFALPGGYLGIHYGLIAVTQDRSELATVMAHELSHVTQRHIARSIDQQNRLTPLMMAALIAGAVAASKNPAAGQALAVGGQAAFIQQGLNFSRDMEREADRVGYNQMRDAGFATNGAVRMFERLQIASRLNDSGAWPYLRTHPLTTERIGDMQSRQASSPRKTPVADDLLHRLMAARARVLAETSIDALRTWSKPRPPSESQQESLAEQAAWLYQTSLAQAQLRDFESAQTTASQLLSLAPENDLLVQQAKLLLADLAHRQGHSGQVLKWLPNTPTSSVSASLSLKDVLTSSDSADAIAPPHTNVSPSSKLAGRAATLWRAQAQLAMPASNTNQAISSLQNWVAQHPNDAAAWQLMARAWEGQGQTLRALRAHAEASMAHADWDGARDRLQAAQEAAHQRLNSMTPADHIEASIIDTRLKLANEKVRRLTEANSKSP